MPFIRHDTDDDETDERQRPEADATAESVSPRPDGAQPAKNEHRILLFIPARLCPPWTYNGKRVGESRDLHGAGKNLRKDSVGEDGHHPGEPNEHAPGARIGQDRERQVVELGHAEDLSAVSVEDEQPLVEVVRYVQGSALRIEGNACGTPTSLRRPQGAERLAIEGADPFGGILRRTISFYVDGTEIGTAMTDWRSIAELSYQVPADATNNAHEVRFVWDGDTQLWNTEGTGTLWVGAPITRVAGQVMLELWTAPRQRMPVTFTLLQDGQPVSEQTVELDDNAGYTLQFDREGTYSLRAKASHWLSSVFSNLVLQRGTIADSDFWLPNGDVDGDKVVTLRDLTRILPRAHSVGALPEDLNGNGVVGVEYMNITLINFARAGE